MVVFGAFGNKKNNAELIRNKVHKAIFNLNSANSNTQFLSDEKLFVLPTIISIFTHQKNYYMKNTIILLSSVLFLSIASCKTKAKTQTTDSTANEAAKTCAATVSFASKGTGIDAASYDSVKALINSKKLKFTEKHFGKEGETELCLPLTELKGSEKTDFINQLKKFENSDKLVSVSTS